MLKIGTFKGLETFSDVSRSQEISDAFTAHGYKMLVSFTFLTFFPYSQ